MLLARYLLQLESLIKLKHILQQNVFNKRAVAQFNKLDYL